MFITLLTTFNVHKLSSAHLHVSNFFLTLWIKNDKKAKDISVVTIYFLLNSLLYEQHSTCTNVQAQHHLYQLLIELSGQEAPKER